jgi:flavin-dependent dehydrogenase
VNDRGRNRLTTRGESTPGLQLENGARVGVIGGGPSGSFFAYFLLDLARQVDLELQVDIFEPRDFSMPGPPGCNMCAGIVSETLVQMLAVEGINLPADVVQRGMDTYVLHTQSGSTRLETPELEKRIGAVFRGAGPLGIQGSEWRSFDGYLLEQALQRGARLVPSRVDDVQRVAEGVALKTRRAPAQTYDLVAVAAGVNTSALKMFQPLETGFQPPALTQTYIREYYLGYETIEAYLGQHAIHFFLLNLPNLDFAAIVPKGNYVTVCLLGKNLSKELFENFLNAPEVRAAMPPEWDSAAFVCHCSPRINIRGAVQPYADRMVFLGDAGVSRLYKDGIGAAYRAAKYAASCAAFHGISAAAFEQHYWRSCHKMELDNRLGKVIFQVVDQLKQHLFAHRALVSIVQSEQTGPVERQRMSKIMWDTFTGSAPYRDIFARSLNPALIGSLIWHFSQAILGGKP